MSKTKTLIIIPRKRIGRAYECRRIAHFCDDTLVLTKKTVGVCCYLSIRLKQNNIFCFVGSLLGSKTVVKLSSGTLKLNVSKKTLKYNSSIVIPYFLKLIPKKIKKRVVLISIIVPQILKRRIFLLVRRQFKRLKNLYFWFNGRKCFNGCRAPKQKRKKRHKYKIFK
jgi:hypothetical protein